MLTILSISYKNCSEDWLLDQWYSYLLLVIKTFSSERTMKRRTSFLLYFIILHRFTTFTFYFYAHFVSTKKKKEKPRQQHHKFVHWTTKILMWAIIEYDNPVKISSKNRYYCVKLTTTLTVTFFPPFSWFTFLPFTPLLSLFFIDLFRIKMVGKSWLIQRRRKKKVIKVFFFA